MPFAEDIVGVVELLLRFVIEMVERFEEKEDLFAIFPIGATMQDGGASALNEQLINNVQLKIPNPSCKNKFADNFLCSCSKGESPSDFYKKSKVYSTKY